MPGNITFFIAGLPFGSIIGYFFRTWYEGRIARSRTIDNALITNFISDYRSFKEVFLPSLHALSNDDTSFIQVLRDEFPKHNLAIQKIILDLDGTRRDRMNEKWAEYKETYEKWNPNSIYADNILHILEQIKSPGFKGALLLNAVSDNEGATDAVNHLLYTDDLSKKYLQYLINDLLDIAKKY